MVIHIHNLHIHTILRHTRATETKVSTNPTARSRLFSVLWEFIENIEDTDGERPEDLSQVKEAILSNQPDQSKKYDGLVELIVDRRNISRPKRYSI